LDLHEYQSKALFAEFGISVPKGYVVSTAEGARDAAKKIGGDLWVVKAQVHAGGRGKAGGIKLSKSLKEVACNAEALLGSQLVTQQSAVAGLPVDKVFVEEGSIIEKELYLSLLVDRSEEAVVIVASAAGGIDIEEVANTSPEQILTEAVDPLAGITLQQAKKIGRDLNLKNSQIDELADIVTKLFSLMHQCDASLIEINPLIINSEGRVLALDGKISIEDNALFRQGRLEKWRDEAQENPSETEARRHGLSYVSLDGNIACLVNGAGLAMATMDLIKLHGGQPANFLDVGGGATVEAVTSAFKIILDNKNVEAILVNIFGGIVRCDLIAEGIIAAVNQVGVSLPVVVRLEGTNVKEGRKLILNSGLGIETAKDLTEAAKKAVQIVNGSHS
tara:strand:+ start:173 stop:1345 length:1173 start_codon:yes stop_codon:yes gene_type:complete